MEIHCKYRTVTNLNTRGGIMHHFQAEPEILRSQFKKGVTENMNKSGTAKVDAPFMTQNTQIF